MAKDKDLEQELADIAAVTERLRVHYQGFFLGLEKRPPDALRDQLERRLRTSVLNDESKAFYKFRFQAAISRYRTMAVYWDRIMRDLESGRTTRAKIRADKGYGAADIGEVETPMMRRVREAAEAARGAGTPDQDQQGDVPVSAPVDPAARLFSEFVEARKSVGLSIDGLTEDSFRKTLDKQKQVHTANPEIKDVEFSIRVKEGRVVVVARPIKQDA